VKRSVVFAAVADDDTGASDLAGMLAGEGVHAILVLDTAVLQEEIPQLDRAQADRACHGFPRAAAAARL
jgi:uncharacterized protein YgbK (DUF1537 family)